jgi:GT2 family glycosyltransferase
MKIIAIVVTYNRLHLLKKCIHVIQQQTRKPDEVIVINNGSTDDTESWLKQQGVYYRTFKNEGGAGGFNNGIRLAYDQGADWIWLMDDDSMPEPTALQYLEEAIPHFDKTGLDVGFYASHVVWTDGATHLMNKVHTYHLKREAPRECFSGYGAQYKPVEAATFVSLLLSAKAVEKVGLPIKEFFIWCDDIEYTKRIVAADMWGVFVEKSRVVHETPNNYCNDVFADSAKNMWKYNYGMRNELYTRKLYKSKGSFYRNVFKRMVIWPFKIISRRKEDRFRFVKMIWRTSIAALRFHPEIERVNKRKN